MDKKGQMTIFILIGLLIILFVGFFIFFLQSAEQEILEAPSVSSVRTYIESCFTHELEQILAVVAQQGGYYAESPYPLQYTFDGETYVVYKPYLSYYLYNGQKSVPTLENVEEAISEGMVASVSPCLNFSVFPYNVTSSVEEMAVQATLSETVVETKISLPITIAEEGATHQLGVFTVRVPTHLYTLHALALLMTEQQYADGNKVCLTCLTRFADAYEVGISSVEFSQEERYTILYRLQDTIEETPFSFMFSFSVPETGTQELTLLSIPDQEVIIGYPFSYTVLGYGEDVRYGDNSLLFDIDQEAGNFSFTPGKNDIGTTIVTITATDVSNQTTSQSFVLTIRDVVASDLVVEPLPYFTAVVDELFFYQVNATSNYTVYFTDDSSLFVIHPTSGTITFTPTASDAGEHNFTITVLDRSGNTKIQDVYMYVVG